jgi:Flp pilus assembly pilin Flp
VPHRSPAQRESGQAAVEFVVLLPLVAVVLAVVFQALVAAQATWQVRVAARAAARAHSFGADPAAAARAHLPARLEHGLLVNEPADGDVRVSIRIPAVLPDVRVGRVAATSHFQPQGQ